jgi:hypothetical protein
MALLMINTACTKRIHATSQLITIEQNQLKLNIEKAKIKYIVGTGSKGNAL